MTEQKLEPTYLYPDGVNPVENKEVKCIKGVLDGLELRFTGEMPKLPLKEVGKAWHKGWDIPTYWAIDAEDNCFYDNAYGYPLTKGDKEGFISLFESEEERRKYQKKFGMKVDRPSWMVLAEQNGWRPTKGFIEVKPHTVSVGGNVVELSQGKIHSTQFVVEFRLPNRQTVLLDVDNSDIVEYLYDE